MRHIILILCVLVFASVNALGQIFSTPIRVNFEKTLNANRSPMMHLDRSGNIYIAWVLGGSGNTNGAIYINVSTDGGMTFEPEVSVCADAHANSDFQRTAQFVIDTKGTLHMVWVGNRVNNQPDVWYVRSSDAGKTWTQPVTLCDADDSSKYAQDFAAIACDSSDNLYASWLDSREVQRKTSTNVHLYFSRSSDGGKTWSTNKKTDMLPGGIGGTCECCSQKIAASPNGHVYIVFRSDIPNGVNDIRDMWLERSNDGGTTFEPALKIMTGDWNINACPVSGPNLTLDDSEGAHIVWRDARDDSNGVSHTYYAYVPNGSTVTPQNIAFDADGSQMSNYPDIALFDHGTYRAIVYQSTNYGLRYILSNDLTATRLVNNRPAPTGGGAGFGTVLFANDGTRYLSWQAQNGSDPADIFFSRETMPLTSASVSTVHSTLTFSLYPNPASGEIRISYSITAPSLVRMIDLLGREVYRTILLPNAKEMNISSENLPSGVYHCLLAAEERVLIVQH
ncbi:MAG TPA: exo-alpha-sialidase [Candidatus Kapabacteria bacterium]|nr:exo-alpha-sialidase [Candidatus Kapabacteria bacterium]